MKIVKVTYTVNSEFASKNQQNVEEFINDIKGLNNPAIRNVSYLGSNGKTFIHIGIFDNDDAQKQFLDLPSFKSFQQQRDASGLEGAEHIEIITLIAASHGIFE